MQVKRFVASDMRRALEMVRQELGPEAIILSSNRTPEGVELLTTLGSDSELAQLQKQPAGRTALSASAPMRSDSAVGEQLIAERFAPQHVVKAERRGSAFSANHPNSGKTGAELVDEIERAHARRLSAQHAEASVKEFLLSQQAKTQAAQAHHTSASSVNDFAARIRSESSDEVIRQARREPARELRRELSRDRAAPSSPENIRFDAAFGESIRAAASPEAPKVKPQTAAERYPLFEENERDVTVALSRDVTASHDKIHATRAPQQLRVSNPLTEENFLHDRRNYESHAQETHAQETHAQEAQAYSLPQRRMENIQPAVTREPQSTLRNTVPTPAMEVSLEKQMHKPLAQENQLADLQAEIADMRLLLEDQLSRLIDGNTLQHTQAAHSPSVASISRRLERMGLPKDVIRNVAMRCKPNKSLNETWTEAVAHLSHQVPVQGTDIVDAGGVFALVGPTGAGKTTTIGKLAARYVLKHGADKVGIVTLDNYRIAAHDQLRSLARILRVPVRVVDETHSLETVLHSLRHCELILIDTAGFRHGDARLRNQLLALSENRQVDTLLVMPCNSQSQMLKASIHAYGAAGLKGCILTKLDETASMGEALGVAIQSKLPIVYTTNGQDIPKHLDVAKQHQIIMKATGLLSTQAKVASL